MMCRVAVKDVSLRENPLVLFQFMQKQIRSSHTDQILRYKDYAQVQDIIYKRMLLITINSAVK